jgi:hypothetical protein
LLIELQVTDPVDDLDRYTDWLANALYDLSDVIDPDLGGSLKTGRLDVMMIVEADSIEDATAKGLIATRTAVQTVGDLTRGRDAMIREIGAETKTLVDA